MRPRQTRKGFTMIELMVVVTVILILAGIGVWVGMKIKVQAEISNTGTTMKILLNAITSYDETAGSGNVKFDHGVADPNIDNFYPLLSRKDSERTIMDIDEGAKKLGAQTLWILDAWGEKMRYTRKGPGGARQIESSGPDGILGNDDDFNSSGV